MLNIIVILYYVYVYRNTHVYKYTPFQSSGTLNVAPWEEIPAGRLEHRRPAELPGRSPFPGLGGSTLR